MWRIYYMAGMMVNFMSIRMGHGVPRHSSNILSVSVRVFPEELNI